MDIRYGLFEVKEEVGGGEAGRKTFSLLENGVGDPMVYKSVDLARIALGVSGEHGRNLTIEPVVKTPFGYRSLK